MAKDSPTTLYRLFDADGDLLYVGIAGNPGRRFEEHAKTKLWWGRVDTIRLQHFDGRVEAADAERQAIRHELPAYNLHGVPTEGRWARPWPGTLRRFADSCEDCIESGATEWESPEFWAKPPTRIWVEGEGITCFYRCPTCGHHWHCWWAWRDIAPKAA